MGSFPSRLAQIAAEADELADVLNAMPQTRGASVRLDALINLVVRAIAANAPTADAADGFAAELAQALPGQVAALRAHFEAHGHLPAGVVGHG